MFFYDTNFLLNEPNQVFNGDHFLISSITLKELENIKTASNKDPDVKYQARKAVHLLAEHEENYDVLPFIFNQELAEYNILDGGPDSKIILTAIKAAESNWYNEEIIFLTEDLCCYHIAKQVSQNLENFKVQYQITTDKDEYTGFNESYMEDEELAFFYNTILPDKEKNYFNLNINEYLVLKDLNGEIVDQYKWTEDGLKPVIYTAFESRMFGKIKPKDTYQKLVMDSFLKNKITMVRGCAGTGKSYLSFGYLFYKLEKGDIDKIIIFCNTVATAGSAKLGFYPGTRDEKLLDSQIGNLLSSKLGDKLAVERLIDEGSLVLLPLSDIRGYDTTNMNAGIYISEAQNLNIPLMKLALERIGEDSFCILDGDSDAQVDLPIYAGSENGMRRVSQVFRNDPCYGEVTLQTVYRSRIARLAQLM